jgi:hypothetical protein
MMEEENIYEQQSDTPDEKSGFHIEGHIKIFDPESDEVYVSARA